MLVLLLSCLYAKTVALGESGSPQGGEPCGARGTIKMVGESQRYRGWFLTIQRSKISIKNGFCYFGRLLAIAHQAELRGATAQCFGSFLVAA